MVSSPDLFSDLMAACGVPFYYVIHPRQIVLKHKKRQERVFFSECKAACRTVSKVKDPHIGTPLLEVRQNQVIGMSSLVDGFTARRRQLQNGLLLFTSLFFFFFFAIVARSSVTIRLEYGTQKYVSPKAQSLLRDKTHSLPSFIHVHTYICHFSRMI